jgi:hypothetical protein
MTQPTCNGATERKSPARPVLAERGLWGYELQGRSVLGLARLLPHGDKAQAGKAQFRQRERRRLGSGCYTQSHLTPATAQPTLYVNDWSNHFV